MGKKNNGIEWNIPLYAYLSNKLFPTQRTQLGTNFKEDFGT